MFSVPREFTLAADKGVGEGEAGGVLDRCAVCNVGKKRSSRGRLIDTGGRCRAPADIQECEPSFVSWSTAVNWLTAPSCRFLSLSGCHLI